MVLLFCSGFFQVQKQELCSEKKKKAAKSKVRRGAVRGMFGLGVRSSRFRSRVFPECLETRL